MVVQNKCKTLKLTYEVGGTDKNGCVVNDSRRKMVGNRCKVATNMERNTR